MTRCRQFYELVTAAETEPLSVEEAKQHLRVDADLDDEDDFILSLIGAAREWVEAKIQRPLVTATYRLKQDRFTSVIEIARCPVQGITSVQYVDSAGTTQTVASGDYALDKTSEPARLMPAYGKWWPSTRGHLNDVTVTFTAGYGAATDVPSGIKAAMKLLIAQLYELREPVNVGNIVNEIELGGSPVIDALLNQYRWEIH